MSKYILRRVLLLLPTLLIASVLVAGMLRLVPGETVDVVTRGHLRTEESRELARARLGLDKPFYEQYLSWMFGWLIEEESIFRSQDGGATWRELRGESVNRFTRITFISATVGWALEEGAIFQTIDGGRTWARQYRDKDRSLNALVFVDEETGWAVGEEGTILQTREGGEPEQTAEDDSRSSWQRQNNNTSEDLTDVTFVNENDGWVVGKRGTVIHTSDGGQTWSRQASGTTSNLSAVCFVDTNNGWVVGEHGTILHTQNGGLTWSHQAGGVSELLTDVACTDVQRGWTVGEGGTILHTSDGGLAWSPHVSNTGQELTAVAFSDALNGLIVGEGGTILRTSDGGSTWTKQESGTSKDLRDISLAVGRGGNVIGWAPGKARRWQWGIVGGNMGQSFGGEESVADLLVRRIPVSVQLMLMSLSMAVLVAIPVGVFSAVRQDTWGDHATRAIAVVGLAVPSFWVATLVVIFASVWFNWSPPLRYTPLAENPLESLRFFAVPALVAALPQVAIFMRMTRATMLEVYREDYIRTAWAKGLRERVVIYRHALKNAMIPVLTLIGMEVPFLLGEMVLIEQIFAVPGLGRLIFESFTKRDFPVVQTANLFIAVIVVLANLTVDVAYAWLNPKIRYA